MRATRSLDHFVIVVGDAESAGEVYEHLGFIVMPLMRHTEIGTCNRVVQLRDTYLELLGDLHRSPPRLHDHMMPRLACGEGLGIVSLTSDDLARDFDQMRRLGLDPAPTWSARRTMVMPDGRQDETASDCFYLWRSTERLCTSLFLSQHHKPEIIWIPEYQDHPNGASHVTALTYVSDDPREEIDYVSTLLGCGPTIGSRDAAVFVTARGERIEFLTPPRLIERYGARSRPEPCGALQAYAIGLQIAGDLQTCRKRMVSEGIPFDEHADRIQIAASEACGVALEFVQA